MHEGSAAHPARVLMLIHVTGMVGAGTVGGVGEDVGRSWYWQRWGRAEEFHVQHLKALQASVVFMSKQLPLGGTNVHLVGAGVGFLVVGRGTVGTVGTGALVGTTVALVVSHVAS